MSFLLKLRQLKGFPLYNWRKRPLVQCDMSRKYKIRDQTYPHFVSFAVIHWIDLFVRSIYRNVLIDSLSYCQKEKGLIVHAWCIMPSHIHLIIGTNKNPMQDILRDFKSFTSRRLKEEIQKNPQESRKD